MIYILPTTDLDTEAIRHDVLNRTTFTKDATVIECGSEAEALDDCSVQAQKNTACQYALVQCGLEEDPQDESPGKDDPDSTEPNNNGGDENVNDDNSNITDPNNNGGSDASDESMDEGVNVDNTGDDESDEDDSDESMDEGDSDESMDEGVNVDNTGDDESDEDDNDESDEGDSDDSMDEGDSDDSMDEGANVYNAGGDERKGLSVGVIAGVVVVVLVSLALVVVGVLILIVVKQRAKQINDTSAEYASELQERGRGEKHLNNPTYDSSKEHTAAPETDQILERNLYNPLYTVSDAPNHQSHTYAVLDPGDPEYAVPDAVHKPTSTGTSDAALAVASPGAPEKHEYEYVETPSTSNK